MDLVIACDGSFSQRSGSPDLATYAFVAWEDRRLICQDSGVVCMGAGAGSMVAEYGAVVAALRWAERRSLPPGAGVRILSDSRSTIERLTGLCAVRRWGGCRDLHEAALRSAAALSRSGARVLLEHVDRDVVAVAHDLCSMVCRLEQSGFTAAPCLRTVSGFLQRQCAT